VFGSWALRGPSARTRIGALLAALACLASTAAMPSPSSAAVPAFCSLSWPGQVKVVWDGGGGDGQWSTGANWSTDQEPDLTYGSTGYVCIPSGFTVTMGAGVQGDLQAIDVQQGATLQMSTGSKLYLFGDQASRPSVVRPTARLFLSGTLGGPGRLDLLGRMWWRSTANGASTIATRDCSLGATCAGPVQGTTGLLEVGDAGVVQVDGRGVNLQDQYRVVVRGQLRLSGQGYVAADRGTGFQLAARTGGAGAGVLTIANDGGYYEGRTLNGLTTLSSFVNGGRIVKSAGAGTSVISATYSTTPAGRVQVDAGTLVFPDGTTQAATVAAGKTYGSGRCVGSSFGCTPTTEAGIDVQSQTFTVPTADTNGSTVQVNEVTGGPADRIGSTVQLHATGLAATPAAPAVVVLRYDSSILGGRTWRDIRVFRQADGAAAYVLVPSCDAQGRPPAGSVGCVDRRGLATSSRDVRDAGDPAGAPVDAIVVVRTTGTSRWVGR
jgi:hypothetical protein